MKLKINDYIITIPKDLEPLLGTAAYKDTGIFSGNVVEVGEDGKIPAVLLPSVAVNNTYVVDNEESMLAIEANVGDIAVRTDANESYILREYPANDIRNWVKLLTSTTGVTSFNGQKGDVVFEVPYYQATGEEANGALTPYGARKELYADEGKTRVQIGNKASAVGALSTAVGSMAKTSKDYSLAVGDNATASEKLTVALGNGTAAVHEHSVALGANARTTRNDTVAVNYGELNRIIEGVKDPEKATDAATKNYVDSKVGNVDLSNYVTLDTNQTITGGKVFAGAITSKQVPNTNDPKTAAGYGVRQVKADGTDGQLQYIVRTNPQLSALEPTAGFSIGISGGANMIYGAGESHIALLKAIETPETTPPKLLVKPNSENAILVADNETYVGTNYQAGATTPTTGNWWRFGKDGKLYSPTGAEYMTTDTDQTILGDKSFGQIITTGKGEEGQVTVVGKDGTLTQTQKIAGSNQYTEIEVAYGHVRVSTIQSDGTPLRNAVLTETGVKREIDRGVQAVKFDSNWEANASQCYITNSMLVINIDGARPKTNISGAEGGIFKNVASLPEATMKNLLSHNWNFEWSSYGGGAAIFAGRLDASDGIIKLYANPNTTVIGNSNRFSISMAIPLIEK